MHKDLVIIISEDDRGHFILMKHRLRKAGISNEIVWLGDGQKTLDFLFGNSRQDLLDSSKKYILLLDIRMPKIDGIEVLERMKRNELLKSVPVIMVTSSDHPDNIQRCNALGCNGYIVKPLDDNAIELIEQAARTAWP